jgi:hypothetical protein
LVPNTQAGPSGLTVTPQAGPWMICVASYTGPQSPALAEELAQEIRTQFRLMAYVFNRSGEEKRREQERVARAREAQKKYLADNNLPPDTRLPPVKTMRIEDQYAVLVGGYKDDAAARKALDQVRQLQPSAKFHGAAYVPNAAGKMHEQAINPFRGAFVCRNPSIPFEKPADDDKPDPRLKEYNADESYSLLKCPKPWTLVVKAYRGAAVIQAQSASSSVFGAFRKNGELLNANAKQAHQVAKVLRDFGFEAYVLHTEYSSLVTIGGYDAPDDPRLVQVQQAFVNQLNNPASNVGQLHAAAQVHFFTQPNPMPVPRVQ